MTHIRKPDSLETMCKLPLKDVNYWANFIEGCDCDVCLKETIAEKYKGQLTNSQETH